MPGDLFIVSAPSGTGKTTLLKRLLATVPGLRFSISYTTRPPREQEEHGREYFFVSLEEFHRLREAGGLLEWVAQFEHCYGTSRDYVLASLDQGFDVVCDIDVRGAKALKKSFPGAIFIFVLPPSLAILEERLQGRGGMGSGEMTARLAQGKDELGEAPWYDFLVVNDHLDAAVDELRAIVLASRCRTRRIWPHLASRFGF